jgi:hypothetical protein
MNLTELDWIGAAPWLLGALLASLALRQAILLIMLMRLRFEAGRSDIVPRDRLPRSVREILNTAAPALAPLGHEYRYSLVLWTGLTEARDRPVYADVYAHASAHAHAWVMPAQAPEAGALCWPHPIASAASRMHWLRPVGCMIMPVRVSSPSFRQFSRRTCTGSNPSLWAI